MAEEINRASPKSQSALLEAMEERQVSIDGKTYPLPRPFFVIATQNPSYQSGTYPLPESQLDRFLMRIVLGYPDHIKWYLQCRQLCVRRYIQKSAETDTDIQHYPPKKFVDWLALHAASSVIAEMHQITTWFIQHEYRATGDNHLTGKQIKAGYKRLKRLSK
jgi:hypothetical protein